METTRLEAFSDGVFAIAITLLILAVHLGGPGGTITGSLAHQLSETWPDYIGYLISFVTIGVMWANHHGIFHLIQRSSHGLVMSNLLLLMCVSFVPFPTQVLSEHLRSGGADLRTAALLYTGTFVVIAALFNLVWTIAATRNRLIVPGLEKEAAEVTRRFRYGLPGYSVAVAVTIFNTAAGLAVDMALVLYYMLPRQLPPLIAPAATGVASGDLPKG